MPRRSRRSREVDLFNFSFLDILACVIGLLIFILSIVVVSGGGSRSRQTAGRLANAEHQLQRAQEAAQRQAERRQVAELTLKEQSKDFADPKAAAAAVRADIGLLEDETAHLDAATLSEQNKTESLSRALQAMGQTPVIDPAASAIQDELRRLDEETADLRNRAADERRKAQANVRQVQFYVPHLREVNRRTVWVEISGDRIYCLFSDDYREVPLGEESTTFIRRAGATGTLVSDMVVGKADTPFLLLSASPDDTVLEVALHPDGYEAFRALRKWAWDKGFSVNWVPQDENTITLTHAGHALEQ
jgi:type II secretory pathway pseudopilin PulG